MGRPRKVYPIHQSRIGLPVIEFLYKLEVLVLIIIIIDELGLNMAITSFRINVLLIDL